MNNQLKIALYGKYGSRKTLQIGHLCEMVGPSQVVIISADQGLNTIASKIDPTNVITPLRFHPLANLLDFKAAYGMAAEMVAKLGPACWLVVDGGSEVHKWIKNEVFDACDQFYEAKCQGLEPRPDLKPWGRFFTGRGSDLTMDGQKIYGEIGKISEQMLSALKALPCNLYINYLEDMQSDNDRKKVLPWGPHVPGKMGLDAIMSTFDFVGRVAYGACSQHLQGKCPVFPEQHLLAGFSPQSREYMARTRDDRTGGVTIPSEMILDFNLARFVEKISGGVKAKAGEVTA